MRRKKNKITLYQIIVASFILVLSIVLIVPSILNSTIRNKKEQFRLDLKSIYNLAEQEWLIDSAANNNNSIYSSCKESYCGKNLDTNKKIEYFVQFNTIGQVIKYYATNGKFQYVYEGNNLNISDLNNINNIKYVDSLKSNERINISNNGYLSYNDTDINSCNYKLVTKIGSFSEEDEEKIICFSPISDNYNYSLASDINDSGDSKYLSISVDIDSFDEDSYIIIYNDESKRFIIDNIIHYNLPKERFNVGDITYSNINEYVKVLGEYNKDDVYIESSPGVEYELFYTDNNAKKVYTDPWILSDNTIEQIDRLKISLMALGYKLTGITNCNIYGSGDICKGNTYYIKYEKN